MRNKIIIALGLIIIACCLYGYSLNQNIEVDAITYLAPQITAETTLQNESKVRETKELHIPQEIIIRRQKFALFAKLNAETLNKGYAQMETSAKINELGQSIIGAHRETFGNILKEVAVNDVITITGKKEYYYQVYAIKIINENEYDKFYLPEKQTSILTLFTCYPVDGTTTATQRLVILAKEKK